MENTPYLPPEPGEYEPAAGETKFCKYCGARIPADAVLCTHCGRQVEQIASQQPQVVIHNTNTNTNVNTNVNRSAGGGYPVNLRNKWTAVLLCLFLGWVGAHKFYEGKTVMGIVYLCTGGLCMFGWIIDLIALLGKPNPYAV